MHSRSLPAKVRSTDLVEYAHGVLAECDALPAEHVTSRHLALPFVDIDARFTDPLFALDCDRSLVPRRGNAVPIAGVRLTIADASADGVSAPASWGEDFLLPLEMERVLAATNLRGSFFHDNRIWEFYDLGEKKGASLSPARGGYPPWEKSAPLRTLLHWVYLGLGLRLVHAATLGVEGRGVLIAGPGGAGKSGLTLAGIIAGLDSVGDDYVLLDMRGQPVAYPVFRLMKQDEAGYRRLGLSRLLDEPGPLNWQGKYEFDFEALGRGRRAESHRIEAILVPSLADRIDTEIRPGSPRDAMLALAPSGVLQLPGDRQAGNRLFAGLVRKLPCYRVDLGRDPGAAARAVAVFLDGKAAR